MNYAQGGLIGATSAYQGHQNTVNSIPVPRTIASAIGRVENLNERLFGVRNQLTQISDQIGGPRELSNKLSADASPQSPNAVSRLNDSADAAHDCLSDIESLLGSIGRALG
jgi:hypothetical protein